MNNIPDFVKKANTEPNTIIVFHSMDSEGHYYIKPFLFQIKR